MPHIIASSVCLERNEELWFAHNVRFIASSERKSIVCVRDGDTDILVEAKPKENGLFIIKHDKLTRPADLEKAKLSLTNVANALAAKILFSNLQAKNKKLDSSHLLSPQTFQGELRRFTGKRIFVEIGFGSGRHLISLAQEHTDAIVIGVEVYQPAVAQALARMAVQNLDNVFIIQYDARLLLELADNESIDGIFVHFPVPWNDSKCRRVFGQRFLDCALRSLKKGGFIELRTDDEEYFDDALLLAKTFHGCDIKSAKNAPARVESKYEQRWLKQGKDIYDLIIYAEQKEHGDRVSEEECFAFTQPITFEQFCEKFDRTPRFIDSIVVRMEEFFKTQNGGLIRLTTGEGSWTQRLYLLVEHDRLSYFPINPLCSSQGRAAHKLICETVYGNNY